ncbi:monovalent cation/H+ antiporter complex subunit F [Streptomyces sp. NBC_01754]|uniref:monovalent cation/H+ antiporter complex subunit F n=1 Tax=Streptomyces sp. NBC_01754 TaxID=2975930 RepID=UPI002DDC238D|nr:monovalent cation/H+ antiporter complex subunit F [Streptomyces sp. NBC_01754]WSC95477.1 monovalent cation/H+ antiporter complex subunit F [Streptomyces sp. NBC_01754]
MSAPETADRFLMAGAVVIVLVAGALLLYRIWRGPSMLDRAISLDVLAALIIAGLGAKSAMARDTFYFPIMLVLAFLGFTGSVGIARFIAVRDRPPSRPSPARTPDRKGPR